MGKDLRGRELGTGLSQRKDGKFYARYISRSGKQRAKYCKSLKEAKAWLLNDRYLDEHGLIRYDKDMTYDDWVEEWFKNVAVNQLKHSTRNTYRSSYNANIKPYIGHIKIKDIKPMQIQNVLNTCVEKEMANRSIKIVRTVIKKTFESAIDNDVIEKSPLRSTVYVKVDKRKREDNYLTAQEQVRFENALTWSVTGMAFRVLLYTGIRIGELMALKWEDVDFKNRLVHIRHTMDYNGLARSDYVLTTPKTENGYRDVPMSDNAYEVFKQLFADKPQTEYEKFQGLIFMNEDGLPYAESNYRFRLEVVKKNANIDYLTIHGLRHSFACRCIESGMELKTLQVIMGHESSSTTMDYYLHVDSAQMRSAIMKTEEYIERNKLVNRAK